MDTRNPDGAVGRGEVEAMRWTLAAVMALTVTGSVAAGEFVLKNGHRVSGELSNEMLMVSTGGAVIEIAPEEIVALTPEEIRLRDGRVLRGTVVGGRLKARTDLGELAIAVDDLLAFRGEPAAREGTPRAAPPAPASPPSPPASATAVQAAVPAPARGAAPAGPRQVSDGTQQIGQGVTGAARGVGRTVIEGADLLHDGAKAFGEAIWDAMKSVGRAARSTFGGS